ncbi:MAG: DNA polymerase IV [Bacteroidales bacterium]|nr:DNA polymerase IV [Bacteroidales bacterium]
MKVRTIIHLDLDSFFVSVERLLNPDLNGKPVIVGSLSRRGVVASCSYEARKFGIHSAMPSLQAHRLCPKAIFVSGSMKIYSQYSAMVTQIIAEASPVFEKASIDEHYIDISGMDRFYGSIKWATELRSRIIKETGLPITCGISINKTLAKMATNEAKPNGFLYVSEHDVYDFLGSLSIKKIPMIGSKSYEKFAAMKIKTIADLRKIPLNDMEKQFGKYGYIIGLKARGIDNRPVTPYWDPKSVSKERTFGEDISDSDQLRAMLIGLTEKTAFEMRRKNKLAGSVTVKIRYSDFDTRVLQKTIPFTNYDHVLIRIAEELFEKLYKKNAPVRLIGVRLANLSNHWGQLDLFEEIKSYGSLYQTMDHIKNKYGKSAILRAISMQQKDNRENY